jgi:hypothetical protein
LLPAGSALIAARSQLPGLIGVDWPNRLEANTEMKAVTAQL